MHGTKSLCCERNILRANLDNILLIQYSANVLLLLLVIWGLMIDD
jgi:hypothetical protein